MVVGRRRRRSDYPLNIRYHGYTCRELNLINTPAQDFSNQRNSPIRVSNENINGLICNQWKLLDFRKNGMKTRQPLALYYKLGALLTNCLTCLDGNQVGESFHCQPPILEEFLV